MVGNSVQIDILQRFIKDLSQTYVYDIKPTEKQGEFKVIWSKPTNSNPMPNPVVNVYFKIDNSNRITFQIENRKFVYRSGSELQFDKALDFVVDSKIVARSLI